MTPTRGTVNGLGGRGFCAGKGGERNALGGHGAKASTTQTVEAHTDHGPAPT
jgi:hypothetical protein